MKKVTRLSACLALAPIAVLAPAAADEVECSFAGGSADALHLEDPSNDWEGIVGGNQVALVPYGDIHGPGTDIVGAWFANDEVGGKTVRRVHILIDTLTGTEVNASYYAEWIWEGGDPLRAHRYVSASPNGRGATQFQYGFIDETQTPSLITDQGSTRGEYRTGSPGEIIIEIPFNRMGNPGPGDSVGEIAILTRMLVGAAGTGLLGVADDTDQTPCFQMTL